MINKEHHRRFGNFIHKIIVVVDFALSAEPTTNLIVWHESIEHHHHPSIRKRNKRAACEAWVWNNNAIRLSVGMRASNPPTPPAPDPPKKHGTTSRARAARIWDTIDSKKRRQEETHRSLDDLKTTALSNRHSLASLS
jgi:hypothetical protein